MVLSLSVYSNDNNANNKIDQTITTTNIDNNDGRKKNMENK